MCVFIVDHTDGISLVPDLQIVTSTVSGDHTGRLCMVTSTVSGDHTGRLLSEGHDSTRNV